MTLRALCYLRYFRRLRLPLHRRSSRTPVSNSGLGTALI
jgi:hypothetical protein